MASDSLVPFLYVAVAPFECLVTSSAPADLITIGDVAKAEYECWAQFAGIFGTLPKYNEEKKAPKYGKPPRRQRPRIVKMAAKPGLGMSSGPKP